jgi:photosystem II stability/assembly factor-like uncharacterized protein
MRFASVAAFVIVIGGACAPSIASVAQSPSSPASTARINDPAQLPRSTATAAVSPVPTDTLLKSAGHRQFRVVTFVDESLGWAAGSAADGKAFLIQTKDGGRTWSALPAPSAYISAGDELRFVDAQHGWLRTNVLISLADDCGRPPTAPPVCRTVILHTGDGGRTWQEQLGMEHAGRLGAGLQALTVLDDQHAWAVRLGSVHSTPNPYSPCTPFGCAIGVVATTDGHTWAPVGDLPALVDGMYFVDAQTGFATVHTEKNESGTPTNTASIVVTHDGGRTWSTQLHVDGSGPRLLVSFIDSQIGFALERKVATCGGSWCWLYGLYRTGDSGQTWNKVLPTPADLSGAWWSPRGRFTALATPMFASATVGWIAITRESDATQDGLMSGVLVTSDGGRTWKRTPALSTDWGEVSDLAAHGSSAWIVGQRRGDEISFVARTIDRGRTWEYPPIGEP